MGVSPYASATRRKSIAPQTPLVSVSASVVMPRSTTAAASASSDDAPATPPSPEYAEWTWRWTKSAGTVIPSAEAAARRRRASLRTREMAEPPLQGTANEEGAVPPKEKSHTAYLRLAVP